MIWVTRVEVQDFEVFDAGPSGSLRGTRRVGWQYAECDVFAARW